MSQDEVDQIIGQLIREKKEASARVLCLNKKLHDLTEHVRSILKDIRRTIYQAETQTFRLPDQQAHAWPDANELGTLLTQLQEAEQQYETLDSSLKEHGY